MDPIDLSQIESPSFPKAATSAVVNSIRSLHPQTMGDNVVDLTSSSTLQTYIDEDEVQIQTYGRAPAVTRHTRGSDDRPTRTHKVAFRSVD